MSDRNVAILACPADFGQPEVALDLLLGTKLALGSRVQFFLAVTGKFKAPRGVQTVNAGANYPAEFARLQTLARWAPPASMHRAQHEDSRSLVCLRQLAALHPSLARIVLLRHLPEDGQVIERCLDDPVSGVFVWPFAGSQHGLHDPAWLMWNREHAGADEALELAIDIALSGAIYGYDLYDMPRLLDDVMTAGAVAKSHKGAFQ